jgi:hypothetical protein
MSPRLLLGLLAIGSLRGADPGPGGEQPVPQVVRVLALGHEPDRKYQLLSNGFYAMLDLDPRELPPPAIHLRLPASSSPGGGREPRRIACAVQLNGVLTSQLPDDLPAGAALPIELESLAPPGSGQASAPERTYREIGLIPRTPGAHSSLVILYNPIGRRTWDGVKPVVLDTSDKAFPPGALLVYNLCPEDLSAQIGVSVGTLAPGQSAFSQPQVGPRGYFDLRLALRRNGNDVQLVDASRQFPSGSKGLLVVYPQPAERNNRAADFVLYFIPPDPKPEPVAPPSAKPSHAGR